MNLTDGDDPRIKPHDTPLRLVRTVRFGCSTRGPTASAREWAVA